MASSTSGVRWPARLVGLLTLLFGLVLLFGGAYLAVLGGSLYFVLMGLATSVAGFLIIKGRALGSIVFAVALVITVFWSLWDAGLDFWPLVSRLFAFGCLGLLIALVTPSISGRKTGFGVAALLAIALIATGYQAFQIQPEVAAQKDASVRPLPDDAKDASQWRHWGNTTEGDRFAALGQITPDNVNQLEVAWTYHTGDVAESDGFGAEDQNTPLQIGNDLFVCTPHNIVISLNATTGEENWRYDSKATAPGWQRCRGLGYYEQPKSVGLGSVVAVTAGENTATAADASQNSSDPVDPSAAANTTANACQRRIFMNTIDARLIALDADTGQPCADFADNGVLDLKHRMGEVKPGYYTLTSSPLITNRMVIVGGRVADNVSVGEPPGVVRAYDVITGQQVWAWDPGNPDPNAVLTGDEEYVRATPNVWSTMAYDAKRDIVYLPTGNTTPDMWGGLRTELDDKYSSSIVALQGATGQELWTFQTVHHDLWDYDVPSQPLLYDIPDGEGNTVPALATVLKDGQIFLLNRVTGEPITEVEERPVPQGDAKGERYAATQPFSVGMPSIGTDVLTESDMWGATPIDQMLCRIAFKQMRYDGPFTPPGVDKSLQWPGSLGGMNWGSVSVDKTTDYMFVNDMRLGLWTRFIPREEVESSGASGTEMGLSSQLGTPYLSERNRFLSAVGIPCQEPPFGTMTAIDLKTKEIVWQMPVGTVEDTGPFGIKMHLPIPIGMPTLGSSVSTESGLLFFAGTQDYYLRAYNSHTGELVWKERLPVGSQGTPMTYRSPENGQQYVVLTAGGARQSPDRGDYVIAWKLPDAQP
jgi:quinate dehydrogenase (quinone)